MLYLQLSQALPREEGTYAHLLDCLLDSLIIEHLISVALGILHILIFLYLAESGLKKRSLPFLRAGSEGVADLAATRRGL